MILGITTLTVFFSDWIGLPSPILRYRRRVGC